MEITSDEQTLLNFYRASELHGGLVLGQMVRRARDPELMLSLTRHSAEEIVHAQLWTETILAVGGRPAPVRETYQSRYAQVIGAPATMLEVLALTQVFERRVYRHFMLHQRRPGTHPVVAAMLARMLDEEKDHLFWVRRWLEGEAGRRGLEVARVLRRYKQADQAIYDALTIELGWRIAA